MILSVDQVNNYKEHGAIILRNIFKPWINVLREGFEEVLNNPGPHARENVSKNEKGRFFEDYCNWHRIPEFLRLFFKISRKNNFTSLCFLFWRDCILPSSLTHIS